MSFKQNGLKLTFLFKKCILPKNLFMYSKLFLLFSISFIFFGCSKPKENNNYGVKNDSVEKYLKLADNNKFSLKSRNQYCKKALLFIDLEKTDTTTMWYLYSLSKNDAVLKDSLCYKSVSNYHNKLAVYNNDTLNLARYYRIKGAYYKHLNNLDSSYFFYSKAEKLTYIKGSEMDLSKIYISKSYILTQKGDYIRAEFYDLKLLLISKKINDMSLIYQSYQKLGLMAHNLKKYKEALGYNFKALKILKKYKISTNINTVATIYNNIGNTYRELEDYEKAIYFFKKALQVEAKTKDDPEIRAYIFNNLAYINLKQKIYVGVPYLLERASIIFDSVQNYDECAISNMYLSDYYYQISDTSKAISYSDKAIELASKRKGSYYHLTTLSHGGYVNKAKASEYIVSYHKINDSLLFHERKNRSLFHKIELETDVIEKEKELAISQKRLYLLTLSLILFIVILLFIIYYQKAKKKEILLLKEQQVTNQELFSLIQQQQEISEQVKQKEKKRIALELHDNIMNKLASTRFNLFSLSKKADKEAIDKALIHIENIKEIEDEIRNITYDLNNDYFLNNQEYKSLIEQFCNNQNSLLGIKYILEYDDKLNLEQLSNLQKLNLYRILQESSNNINKHSNASEALISLIKEEETVLILIQDNGIGFDTNNAYKGIGLKGIKQRVTTLNGKISIQSGLNMGTKIFISFPL